MIRWAVPSSAARFKLVLAWYPVVVVPPVLLVDAAVSATGKPITALGVLAAIVSCLPLVLRRRVPFRVLLVPLVGGIVLALWQLRPGSTVVLIPMIALFDLALIGDRRRSASMALMTVPSVFISVVPFVSGPELVPKVIRNLLLCLLVIAAGDLVRAKRVAAQRTAAAREEETLRRVADERLQIAREIHDTVAHAMTAINVQAGVAAHLLQRDPAQAYDALRAIKQSSGEALGDLRRALTVLRDPLLGAPLGPAADLQGLEPLTAPLRAAGVTVAMSIDPVSDLPASVQSTGYRIVQEALTNVSRHAHAANASVNIRRAEDRVRIEVADDGTGAANGSAGAGNGLRGMRERVLALGGTLQAAPQSTGGWRVSAMLPTIAPPGAVER